MICRNSHQFIFEWKFWNSFIEIDFRKFTTKKGSLHEVMATKPMLILYMCRTNHVLNNNNNVGLLTQGIWVISTYR